MCNRFCSTQEISLREAGSITQTLLKDSAKPGQLWDFMEQQTERVFYNIRQDYNLGHM